MGVFIPLFGVTLSDQGRCQRIKQDCCTAATSDGREHAFVIEPEL
jgi:hypothetical protein